MSTKVIYHSADFDGIFSREVARCSLPHAEFIGWDYGQPVPEVSPEDTIYMIDISIPELMNHPDLVWIDHHISAMKKYPEDIPGYRLDGVAACRLAYQYFAGKFPTKQEFIDRKVSEPLAVRLAGEYDIWDKRDPRVDLFQAGLNTQDLDFHRLLHDMYDTYVDQLIRAGEFLQYSWKVENARLVKGAAFDLNWKGLKFCAVNHSGTASGLFEGNTRLDHDACLTFRYADGHWRISLRRNSLREKDGLDLSKIASEYGGGGHAAACGFECKELPFKDLL